MPGHLRAHRAHGQAGADELPPSHLSQEVPERVSNTAGGLGAGHFIAGPTAQTNGATHILTSDESTCCLFPGSGVQRPAPRHPPAHTHTGQFTKAQGESTRVSMNLLKFKILKGRGRVGT